MRELTQVLRVKAVLLASAEAESVACTALRLQDLDERYRWDTAALCLAVFDGDVAYADYAVRKTLQDGDWVRPCAERRMAHGLPVDMPSLLVARLQWVRAHQLRAKAGRS